MNENMIEKIDQAVDKLFTISGMIVDYSNLLLAFTAALLTILFGLLALGGYTLLDQRKANKQLKGQLNSLKAMGNVAYSNITTAADIALMQLPEFTYTQQIPSQLYEVIRLLENNFTLDDGKALNGKTLWEHLNTLNCSERIRFARALHYMAQNADNPVKMKKKSILPENDSVIDLLKKAQENSESRGDVSLDRIIRLRLSQAYRQIDDFDNAKKILTPLEDREDSSAKMERAIIDLQQGFAADNKNEKIDYFRQSKNRLMPVFSDEFGWEKSSIYFYSSDVKERGSIAYYTAKSMWSWFFSMGNDYWEQWKAEGNQHSPENQEFVLRFPRAMELALNLFLNAHKSGIHDPYVQTIYHLCVAYLLVVINSCDFLNKRMVENTGTPSLSTATIPSYTKKCLKTARDTLNMLSRNGSVLSIYVEGTERLGSFGKFHDDIAFLEEAIDDRDAMFKSKLFGGSKS